MGQSSLLERETQPFTLPTNSSTSAETARETAGTLNLHSRDVPSVVEEASPKRRHSPLPPHPLGSEEGESPFDWIDGDIGQRSVGSALPYPQAAVVLAS